MPLLPGKSKEKDIEKVAKPEAEDSDHEAIMDQVAKEMMEAIETKDKDKLLDAFHCLVADMIDKMSSDTGESK